MSQPHPTFDETGDAQLPRRVRVTALGAALLMLGFSLVDLMVLPAEAVVDRTLVRLAFTPLFAVAALVSLTRFGQRHARVLAVATSAVLAIDMSALAVLFPQKESVGFFPAMIFMAAMLPMPRRWVWSAQLVHPLSFFLLNLAADTLWRSDVLRHGGNLLLSTVVAMGAVYIAEGLRRSMYAAAGRQAEANRRLLELDRLRAQFVAEVSQELRTPLAAALLALEADSPTSPSARGALRPLRRLRGLVDELLELSRIDARMVTADGLATDLPPSLIALVEDFRGAFQANRVEVSLELPDTTQTLVPLGAAALDRIIVNMLGHALRRAPRDSTVRVRAQRTDGRVTVEVSDAGPPLPAEFLPHVFERFAVGPSPLGDAVGLALARELVDLSGGRIECESTQTQTTLRATWPLAAGPTDVPDPRAERIGRVADAVAIALDGRPGQEPEQSQEAWDPKDPRPLVLVVESHAQLALRVAETLRPEHRTLVAHDGATALARLEHVTPDLVVMDLRLDDVDGLDVLQRLRSSERTRLTPVLVLCAVADKEPLVAAMRAGADDIMAKPFDREMLRARADALLRMKRRRDEREETRRVWNAACEAMGATLDARITILRPKRSGHLLCMGSSVSPAPGDGWGAASDAWVEALVEHEAQLFAPGELPVSAVPADLHVAAVAMSRSRHLVGLILATRPHAAFTTRELEAIQACARYALLRVERDEVFGHQARSADERRRLLSAVLVGQDGERRRLARDLHDGTGQVLIAAALHLDLALQCADEASMRQRLSTGRALVDDAVNELRALSRDLHPPTLAQFGLAETLQVLARSLSSHELDIDTRLGEQLADLRPDLAIGVYRIAQAALANVVRHARARHAALAIHCGEGQLMLEVTDDGVGFQPSTTDNGVGLLSIRERAESLGGRVELDSAVGRGTRLRVTLPLDAPPGEQQAA